MSTAPDLVRTSRPVAPRARSRLLGAAARLVPAIVALGTLAAGSRAAWSMPELLSFSGFLTDATGEPVHCADPQACFSMRFRVYQSADGGTAVWDESMDNVPVLHGVFHVLLGQQEPLYLRDLDVADLWLGIQVGDNPEMRPRQRVASTVFAFFASLAEVCEDALLFGGQAPESYVQRSDLATVARSGQYADLRGRPELRIYATGRELLAHGAEAAAHHGRYTDAEARGAVGSHFSGDYADLSGAPALDHFATKDHLSEHACTEAAHHARYTDEEAREVVRGLVFSGDYGALANRPDLSVFATRDQLWTHELSPEVHHARYTDDEALAAVGPHFSGTYGDLYDRPDLDVFARIDDLAGHAADDVAHHARYGDAEAVAAVGPHFSGHYGDLTARPDLGVFATILSLEWHQDDAAAHHLRYSDAEALAAVGPHFSGDYGDLRGAPDLEVFATEASLDVHLGAAAAHHARYTDGEAIAAVEPLLFSGNYEDLRGTPSLDGFLTTGDLQTHAHDGSAHHARFTDAEAVAAVGPHFSGDYVDLTGAPDLGIYVTLGDLQGHLDDAGAHHARYTDAEAAAAAGPHFSGDYADLVGAPDLGVYAAHADLLSHSGTDDAHHARYTDDEARAAVEAEALPLDVTPRQIALKRWYVARRVEADYADVGGAALVMESDGERVFVVAGTDRVQAYDAHQANLRYFATDPGCHDIGDLALDGWHLWITCSHDGQQEVVGLATRDGAVQRRFSGFSGSSDFVTIVFDGSRLWLADAGVRRVIAVDPATGSIVRSIAMSSRPTALAFDGQNLWWAKSNGNYQIYDVETGVTVYAGGTLPTEVKYLVWTGGAMWASVDGSAAGGDLIVKIDPAGGAPLVTVPLVDGADAGQICFDGRRIWATLRGSSQLAVLDAVTGDALMTFHSPESPRSCAFDGAGVWIGAEASSRIRKY